MILLTKLENFSIERLKDDLQKVKKNAAIKKAAAAAPTATAKPSGDSNAKK